MKYLERIANIAVIVAVVVFLGVVIQGELVKRRSQESTPQALLGKVIALPGIHFSQKHNSLVIAISSTCHFCKESLPFYKNLAAKSQNRLDVIAVLPQQPPEAQAFLKEGGVDISQVISANLNSIGIAGTPTILLIDQAGIVKKVWFGELSDKDQQELLRQALPETSI